MRDSRLDELISAYLDGELSSEERTLVEGHLAESAASRALLEQLRQQQQLLATLPRLAAPRDLASRIAARLAESPGSPPKVAPIRTVARRRFTNWKVALGVATMLAAGLLVAVMINDFGKRIGPDKGTTPEPLAVDLVALQRFQQQFAYIVVCDIGVSPAGQQAKVIEASLLKAGVTLQKSVRIEDRLEKGILDSRFIGDDRISLQAPVASEVQDDVEMVFVRGTANQLDLFFRELMMKQATDGTVAKLRMDLATATKELAVFLNLNQAINPNLRNVEAQNESWRQPGAYRLQFRLAMHSQSLSRLGAIAAPGLTVDLVPLGDSAKGQVATDVPAVTAAPSAGKDFGNDPNQPSQMLLIIRNLK